MARKIPDMIQILLKESELVELNSKKLDQLMTFIDNKTEMEALSHELEAPLESMLPNLGQAEVDKVRTILDLILTHNFGLSRDDVYSLLYSAGSRIVWH